MQKRRSKKRKKANRIPPSTFIIFSLMVLLSAIGLDYIGWKNGEKSYLFSSLAKKERAILSQEAPPSQEPPPGQEALDQIVIKSLTLLKIPYDSNQQYRDKKGVLHLMIDLPLKKYKELESLLEKEFNKVSASVQEKEEQLGEYSFRKPKRRNKSRTSSKKGQEQSGNHHRRHGLQFKSNQ